MNSFYLLVPLFLSCGIYSTKGTIPIHINSIFIMPIQNESSEFSVGKLLSNLINEQIINENILRIENQDNADSELKITIKSVTDMPYTYTLNTNELEQVEEWRVTLNINLRWSDYKKDKILVDTQLSSHGIYSVGIDISMDGIDNDNDGLIDTDDIDEFGSPKESAIKIALDKITELIINEITSTW